MYSVIIFKNIANHDLTLNKQRQAESGTLLIEDEIMFL